MSQKLNIYNDVWIERLFQGRNQAYGAYQLRKANSSRHLYGLIIALTLFISAIGLPFLIKQITPERTERVTEVTVLSSIEIEQQKLEQPKEIIIEKIVVPLKSTIQATPPRIAPDEEVTEEQEMKTQEELIESNLTISVANVEGTDDEHGIDIAELNQQIVDEVKVEAPPLEFAENMPEFPGGNAACIAWLTKEAKYPVVATEMGLSGTVMIGFVVERDGSITNVKVNRGVDPILDREAVRAVSAMPKWIPGKQNGEPVRVYHSVPVIFRLQNR